jgi:hypothetical protein
MRRHIPRSVVFQEDVVAGFGTKLVVTVIVGEIFECIFVLAFELSLLDRTKAR